MTKIQAVANMGYETYITKDFHAGTDTTMTVYDASQMPVAPSSVCINSLDNRHSIIISYTAINGNVVTVGSVIHSNGSDAETATYLKGCNVFKEFSDSVGDGSGGGGGTTNYAALVNKPKVNGVELLGDKNAATLGLVKNNWGTTEAGKVLKIGSDGLVTAETGGSGTTDYNALSNKPQVNGVTLSGNKTLDEIGAVKIAQGTAGANKYLGTDATGNVVLKDSASVAFVDITGEPDDNVKLADSLAKKVDTTWGTSHNGKVLGIVDGEVTTVSPAGNVLWGQITGTLANQTDLAAEFNKRIKYDDGSADKAFTFGRDGSGNLYIEY